MRTAFAFVLGAALVSTSWAFAGPTGHANAIIHRAPHGPPVLEGLGEPVADFGWQGPGGESAQLADLLVGGPVVVAIRDLNCPVSQRYGSTLEALEATFAAEGVQFLYVDLTPQEVGWNVRMPRDQAGLGGTYVRHVDDDFFAALSPQTTTEVFLIDSRGLLRYRGAVDDQYGIDFARQAPRTLFLEDGLRAVLDGEERAKESTFAPGCYLPRHLEGLAD